MKKLSYRSGSFWLGLAAVLLTAQLAMASSGHSLLDVIKEATEPVDNTEIESAHTLTMKTVEAKETYQGGTFRVLARKDEINRFRCSVCHSDKKVLIKNGALYTHSDIVINHGKGDQKLDCIQCHDEKNRDVLSDAAGAKIDFDHSYQLCGQCHFRQKRDWLGGAHGKREAYWAGERVVNNCTSCHNPHSPAFEVKMPETYSLPFED